jgi:hypothetical protein
MPRWLETGRPPAASSLRDKGFCGYRSLIDDPTGSIERRHRFCGVYGFAIPCAEAIDALLELGPILEVGAGTGMWSAMLAARGADVIATDRAAPGSRSYAFVVGHHFAAQMKLRAEAAIKRWPGRAVFCSWPCYRDPWFARALKHVAAGVAVAVIHEGHGGCVGTDSMFDRLEADFEELREIAIPQFPSIRDRLTIWRRKG